MMKINTYFLSLLLCIVFGCYNHAKSSGKSEPDPVLDILVADTAKAGNQIDYDNTEVIGNLYITDRNGADAKEQAEGNSATLGTYAYGTKLEVIEETEKWVGVRDRITREFVRHGNTVRSTSWEKVYVSKTKLGPLSEIVLVPSDLNMISLLTVNEATEFFEEGQALNEYLKIELIDKSLFDSKKNSAVDFLLAGDLGHGKKNGIIELKCQNGVVKYVDKLNAEDDEQVFRYIGQFEFLNKYLIGGTYWESYDYKLVDKVSGEETATLGAYPQISPDKQNIIAISANPYELTADLELYTISNQQIKHKMSASFNKWMPTVEPGEIFWAADQYLYVAVNHVNAFWKEDGSLNEKCQYIRIRLL